MDAVIWIFLIGGVALIATMVYDTCFRCNHEWKQHIVKKGEVTKTYLTCKKCGKVKYLK